MQKIKQQLKQLELLRQLIGEWSVDIVMKVSDDKVIFDCGVMFAVEIERSGISAEIKTHIEN